MTDITVEIVAQFRSDYSGFSDVSVWPDAVVTRQLQKADRETGGVRWGVYADLTIKQEGLFLFAAHRLCIDKAQAVSTAAGGTPSSVSAVTSKSVGDESVSYAVDPKAGDSLQATSYGQEFTRVRERVGMGAISSQVGGYYK